MIPTWPKSLQSVKSLISYVEAGCGVLEAEVTPGDVSDGYPLLILFSAALALMNEQLEGAWARQTG
jgi:hypothetical protein